MAAADPGSLELVLRGWQERGATVAVSCVGPGMRVVFSGRIGAARKGAWTLGNGRVGLVFDVRYATGHVADSAKVPESVRACIPGEFGTVMELLLETGDECWFCEVRPSATASGAPGA